MTAAGGTRAGRVVLMNPGPVNTDGRVRAALSGPDICHREPEFADLLQRVRAKVTRVADGGEEHGAVILTGSGTTAVEAAISSVVPAHGSVLALDNGHYGHRMAEIARSHGIGLRHLRLGWGARIEPAEVARILAAEPDLSHVLVVHHETSTGMLNDVSAVARVAHEHGRQVIVDAVSSIGAEAISLREHRIDWLAGSANKCLEGMPGLSFVCGREAGFAALASLPSRSFSLDLHRHYLAQVVAGAPAFTPGIPAFYAFDVALDLMLAEGVRARGTRYRMLAERLRDGLRRLGLELLLEPGHRALSLTAVALPDGIGYPALHRAMRAGGFVVYPAQEELAGRYWRLSTMGSMTTGDIDAFLDCLAGLLPGADPRER